MGLFTGLWSAAALTGKVTLAIPRLALAAHLNGLLGGLWLIAVSVTIPYLRYDDKQTKRLACLVIVPCWANLIVTFVASILGHNGLQYTGVVANDVTAFLLQATVVLPSLVGGVYWVRGFTRQA